MYNFTNYDRQVGTTLSLMTGILTEIRNNLNYTFHISFMTNP